MTAQNVYDAVPYPNLSHSDTHPDKAATIAKLLNLSPADITACRVLELGCASGGNLMPMAEALPNSTFVGVDYSERQIEQAQNQAEKLNLTNITFHAMDILDIDEDFGQFDYIMAHGIYSWVAADVRDHVLAVCSQNLAPHGIAYVSYNTLPGWYSLLLIRDLMLWHTRNSEEPVQKMTDAYEITSFLTASMKSSGHNPPYAMFLDKYMERRFQYDKDNNPILETSLLHDEMEVVNYPLYFKDFVAHAAEHNLQYVAEVPFVQVMLPDIPVEIKKELGNIATNLLESEQYTDFLRHRTFRRTLLCHDNLSINRSVKPDPITQFYVGSRAHVADADEAKMPENVEVPPNVESYTGSDDITISTDHQVSQAALQYLIETREIVAFETLFKTACERLGLENPAPDDKAKLLINLLQGFSSSTELVEFFTYDPGIVTTISDKPCVRPLARLDAANHDQATTTNLKHERVTLDGFIRLILPYLDGEHDRDALLDELIGHIAAGHIVIRDEKGETLTPENARETMDSQVDIALRWLARSALIIG